MKKTYKNPELEVVKIQTMQMLAASDTTFLPLLVTGQGEE